MTDQGAHVATDQETALYEAMSGGDWDTVEEMRQTALEAGELEQYQTDHGYAHGRYQADHEMPEDEREQNTAEQVEEAG